VLAQFPLCTQLCAGLLSSAVDGRELRAVRKSPLICEIESGRSLIRFHGPGISLSRTLSPFTGFFPHFSLELLPSCHLPCQRRTFFHCSLPYIQFPATEIYTWFFVPLAAGCDSGVSISPQPLNLCDTSFGERLVMVPPYQFVFPGVPGEEPNSLVRHLHNSSSLDGYRRKNAKPTHTYIPTNLFFRLHRS
jgi:hypothetical protein